MIFKKHPVRIAAVWFGLVEAANAMIHFTPSGVVASILVYGMVFGVLLIIDGR